VRVVGYDTETPFGDARLLARSDGEFIESDDTDERLNFLWDSHGGEGTLNVFWNLGFDIGAILKPFVAAHIDKLHSAHYKLIRLRKQMALLAAAHEADPTPFIDGVRVAGPELLAWRQLREEIDGVDNIDRFATPRFKIQRVGDKGFGLRPTRAKRKDKTRWFFDAEPFYSPGGFQHVPLGLMAQKYLGETKSDAELGIDRALIGTERGYYARWREKIIPYCVQDALLTARLMERTIAAYEKLGFPFPERPFSKGSISKEYLRQGGSMDATQAHYRELREGPDKGAWNRSFRGGVFLLMGVGTPPSSLEVHDINSAYPWALLQLPSLEGAVLIEPSDPRWSDPRTYFKFHKVRLERGVPYVPERDETGQYSRLLYRWTATPRTVHLAEPDLSVLRERGCPFEVLESVGVFCPSTEHPFAFLTEMFDKKSEAKRLYGEESVEYLAVKIPINGMYGILAQRKPRESRWTNLIYASYVTALCREQLWRRAAQLEADGSRIVQYATDGLVVLPNGHLPRPSSDRLGEWEVSTYARATFFETGVYVAQKPAKPEKLKRRGFPDLTPEELRACEHPYWESHRSAPMKLKTAIIRSQPASLNVWQPVERTFHPYESAVGTGAMVPPELATVPLRDYFSKWWWLELGGSGTDRASRADLPGMAQVLH
jgi:hypothetical protein